MSDIPTEDWTWINDLADRFERAWDDSRPKLEDYLADADESRQSALFEELLHVELELRRKAGETPLAEEYLRRFPELAAVIDEVFRGGKSGIFGNGKVPSVQAGRRGTEREAALVEGVLDGLSLTMGSVPRVLLRETEFDDDSAVVRPCSAELPGGAGRHQLLGEIGHGGMGVVLKGRDPQLGRDLAIKVLREEHRDDPDLICRFIEEAQILGQLVHPGIVPIHELGRLDDGRPYFTMKLVRGRTLTALLADRKYPDEERSRFLAIFEQVCQAVAYAHARGVIHRDLKTLNIMVGSFGEVQLMDWGLAKVLLPSRNSETRDSAEESAHSAIRTVRSESDAAKSNLRSVLGTPAYMAPEQARGEVEDLSERSDVFGLGSILCEILTGQPAYAGSSGQAILRKALRGETADALERLDGCGADAELISLARRCLEVDPSDRPRDAGEVARRLDAYLAGVQERMRAAELARAAEEARAEEAKATAEAAERARAAEEAHAEEALAAARAAEGRARAERRARRMTVGLAASVLVAGVLGAAGWTWVERDRVARLTARATQVGTALQEAREHRARAQAAEAGDLVAWTEALDSAQRARDLLEPGLDPALRTQAESLLAVISAGKKEAETAAAAARADRLLLDQLADIRSRWVDSFDAPATEAEYAEVFREAGIDVLKLSPSEAAARIRARRAEVALSLAAGLDHWADMLRSIRKDYGGATRLTAVAREADPDPWRDRLREAIQKPRGSKRIAALRELARSSTSADLPAFTFTLLALGLLAEGDPQAAESVLRPAARRYPRDVWLNLLLGNCLHALKRTDEAIRYYMVARFFRPDTAHALAHVLSDRGESDEARAIFQELVSIRPDVGRHWTCYGRLLQERGDRVRAADVLSRAVTLLRTELQRRSNDDSVGLVLGLALHAQGKPPEAIAAYNEAIRINPRSEAAHNNLGWVLGEQGKLTESIAEFCEAIHLNPDFADAHYNLGNSLARQGKHAEAMKEFREAIRIKPEYALAQAALGDVLRDQGKPSEAISEYRQAIRIKPDLALAHGDLGETLRNQGRLEEAITELKTAIRLDPHDPIPHNNLGNALRDQGKLEEAVGEYKTAIRLDPYNPIPHNNLGNALLDQDRVAEAIPEFRSAIDLKPDLAASHENLSIALRGQGALAEATAESMTAIRLDPRDAAAHRNLAAALYVQGKPDEAIVELRAAIQLKPDDDMSHDGLGAILCDIKHEYAQAEAEFREAIRLKPKRDVYHMNLGNVLSHQRKLDRAIAEYREAIRLNPANAAAHHNLGSTLHEQGKADEAVAELREAIRLNRELAKSRAPQKPR